MKVPISTGIIANAIGGLRGAVNGWFGPSTPLVPVIPEPLRESVTGRQFDFPVAFNRTTKPRGEEAVSFSQLRELADACDVLRVVIETRKDQVSKLRWAIKPIEEDAIVDERCTMLRRFFQMPDREHDWDTWLRMLLEDLFVIDAPCIYPRKTLGGEMFSLEPVDGATVKRVIDDHGRTPVANGETAYQQVFKGVPVINYSYQELIYKPRNVRTWKVYGYSPVEQIITVVNIALRRTTHQLQYYTEGNIPEALIGVPPDWDTKKVSQFQEYWDTMHEGDSAAKRHAKFVPGDMKYQETKPNALKDEFDEWLARVVCFCFSIEPTAFIKQQNRATADTAREAALEEGLSPIMQWVTNVVNYIIWYHFGFDDIHFIWVDELINDPLASAQINEIYLRNGVLDVDEVRTNLGREPLTEEQKASIAANRAVPMGVPQPFDDTGVGLDGEGLSKRAMGQEIHHHHINLGDTLVDVGATTINVDAERKVIPVEET